MARPNALTYRKGLKAFERRKPVSFGRPRAMHIPINIIRTFMSGSEVIDYTFAQSYKRILGSFRQKANFHREYGRKVLNFL